MTFSKDAMSLRVVICGLGNIGSQLLPLLARCSQVRSLLLIDHDTYSTANVMTQDIVLSDVGRPKVQVAARRAKRIGGTRLSVEAMQSDLAEIPLGLYHDADIVLGCLDGPQGRIALAKKAWRAGRWYIDTGVNPDGQLARVTTYGPIDGAACYLCAIADWQSVGATYPCQNASDRVPPTNAPAFLGAAAAALAMSEFGRLLACDFDPARAGREVVLDLHGDHLFVTRHVLNPGCRFDHRVWRIDQRVPVATRLGDLLYNDTGNGNGTAVLRHESYPFVRKLLCVNLACGGGGGRALLRLGSRLRLRDRRCPVCGQDMVAGGFDQLEEIGVTEPRGDLATKRLSALGLLPGDVLEISSPAGERHVLLEG